MYTHKILDPVHSFIRFDDTEKRLLSLWPMQRLRYIHQNAAAYLLYPGATHSRFEHALGTMEMATRVFDTITAQRNRSQYNNDIFPTEEKMIYWRSVVRLAALCHDIGHLPFSHAVERDFISHEILTKDRLFSSELKVFFEKEGFDVEDIAEVALGEKVMEKTFSSWKKILSEVITGDVFGADRMDYLLRDSYYTGAAFGKFDHYRLIDMLRILPEAMNSERMTLGIEEGGISSAEDLLFSRYCMFKQVYFHAITRVYSLHLSDFLKAWMAADSTVRERVPEMTDNEVLVAMLAASREKEHPGHKAACCMLHRKHDKLLYKSMHSIENNYDETEHIYIALEEVLGKEVLRRDTRDKVDPEPNFSVLTYGDIITNAHAVSSILLTLPPLDVEYIFIQREEFQKGKEVLHEMLYNNENE
jgi:uncharacterized protein